MPANASNLSEDENKDAIYLVARLLYVTTVVISDLSTCVAWPIANIMFKKNKVCEILSVVQLSDAC